MRLIDGDELLSIVRHMTVVDKSVMHRTLIQMPTVDAAPVVRCQDCKWYQPDADKWCGYFECMGFEPDNYCSQGERKGGKGNENH